jgi:hypothetical protein
MTLRRSSRERVEPDILQKKSPSFSIQEIRVEKKWKVEMLF